MQMGVDQNHQIKLILNRCLIPTNVANLQSFPEPARYYNLYVRNMHKLRALSNKLLKNVAVLNSTIDCQTTFEDIKKILRSELFLIQFNPDLETTVASDDSDYEIGAVI